MSCQQVARNVGHDVWYACKHTRHHGSPMHALVRTQAKNAQASTERHVRTAAPHQAMQAHKTRMHRQNASTEWRAHALAPHLDVLVDASLNVAWLRKCACTHLALVAIKGAQQPTSNSSVPAHGKQVATPDGMLRVTCHSVQTSNDSVTMGIWLHSQGSWQEQQCLSETCRMLHVPL